MSPFWTLEVLVPELLVYWAKVSICSAGGNRNLGIVSLTRYIGQYPGRHLPRLQIAYLPSKSPNKPAYLSFLLYYIMIYASIYRYSPSRASAARALIRSMAKGQR